jgi:hypothetical protein
MTRPFHAEAANNGFDGSRRTRSGGRTWCTGIVHTETDMVVAEVAGGVSAVLQK